jgi:hypothetical protein
MDCSATATFTTLDASNEKRLFTPLPSIQALMYSLRTKNVAYHWPDDDHYTVVIAQKDVQDPLWGVRNQLAVTIVMNHCIGTCHGPPWFEVTANQDMAYVRLIDILLDDAQMLDMDDQLELDELFGLPPLPKMTFDSDDFKRKCWSAMLSVPKSYAFQHMSDEVILEECRRFWQQHSS